MAKRATRSPRGGKSAKATSRQKEKKAAAVIAEVEVVEESGGAGAETAIAIFTFIALVTGFLMVDQLLGGYGEGLFFAP